MRSLVLFILFSLSSMSFGTSPAFLFSECTCRQYPIKARREFQEKAMKHFKEHISDEKKATLRVVSFASGNLGREWLLALAWKQAGVKELEFVLIDNKYEIDNKIVSQFDEAIERLYGKVGTAIAISYPSVDAFLDEEDDASFDIMLDMDSAYFTKRGAKDLLALEQSLKDDAVVYALRADAINAKGFNTAQTHIWNKDEFHKAQSKIVEDHAEMAKQLLAEREERERAAATPEAKKAAAEKLAAEKLAEEKRIATELAKAKREEAMRAQAKELAKKRAALIKAEKAALIKARQAKQTKKAKDPNWDPNNENKF